DEAPVTAKTPALVEAAPIPGRHERRLAGLGTVYATTFTPPMVLLRRCSAHHAEHQPGSEVEVGVLVLQPVAALIGHALARFAPLNHSARRCGGLKRHHLTRGTLPMPSSAVKSRRLSATSSPPTTMSQIDSLRTRSEATDDGDSV